MALIGESGLLGNHRQRRVILAIFDSTSTTALSVALGDASHPGSFLAPTFYSLGPLLYPTGIVAGDFNGDGTLDIAVAGSESLTSNAAGGVDVFSGEPNHRGEFLSPSFQQGTGLVESAADLNGDGLYDLIYTEFGDDGPSIDVSLGQRTEDATASNVSTGSTAMAYAYYPGDNTYGPVDSCEIPLGATPGYGTISKVTESNLTETSATVNWTSNLPAYGQVQYTSGAGPTSISVPTAVSTPWDPSESITHSFVLSNLTPGTQYDYAIHSQAYFSGCRHYFLGPAISAANRPSSCTLDDSQRSILNCLQ